MKQIPMGRLAGRFKMEAISPDGTRRDLTGWFDNLITNVGLNRIGTAGPILLCAVGSGSTAPAFTDTTLQALIATTGTVQSLPSGAQGSPPYFGWQRWVMRFAPGSATGNISEVGMGWTESGFKAFSRALVLDGDGDPTTVTVLADETLDVTYELRLYPPLDDVEATIEIEGVDYDIVVRAATVNTTAWTPGAIGPNGSVQQYVFEPRSGPIGTITQSAGGTGGGGTAYGAMAAYSNNSLLRSGSVTFALDYGNIEGGIGAMNVMTFNSAMGRFQVSFNPKIPKTASLQLTLPFTWSWGRYAP